MPTNEKKCGRCGETKPISAFHKRARSIDGLQAFCKDCHNANRRRWRAEKPEQNKATYEAWREANRERIVARAAEYRRENREKLNEYNREWRKRNKDRVPFYYTKSTYGLSREEYEALLEKQGGVCAICKQKCRVHPRLSVDHCHRTNVIRGLLCHACNTALGKFEDDPNRLLNAIEYLTKLSRENDECPNP